MSKVLHPGVYAGPEGEIDAGSESIKLSFVSEIEAELTEAQRRRIISELSSQHPAKGRVADA